MSKKNINTDKYINEINKLSLTDERKLEIMSNIKKDANQSKVIPFSRVGKIAVAVACICVTTTVTAYAIGVLKSPSEVFSPIFGVEAEQTIYKDLIDKIGTSIGVSSTSNGVTITLDGIIGDKNNAYVVYTITNEDGSKIELTEDIIGSLTPGLANGTQLPDDYTNWSINRLMTTNEDGYLQLIEEFTIEDQLPIGEMLVSEFTKFSDYHETFIIEGNWKIEYSFDYEDTSIVIDVNETYSKYNKDYDDDVNYTIESLRISPISIVVNWSSYDIPDLVKSNSDEHDDIPVYIVEPNDDNNAVIVETVKEIIYGPPNPQILIHQKDGNVVNVIESPGFIAHNEEGFVSNQTSVTYERIILLEDIDKIQVGDIFVPMP